MSELAPETPHFAFPFGRGANGKIEVCEQGSEAHVTACANVIARCQLGARPERPEFGWRWPYMHLLPLDLTGLTDALARFEPRARALGTQAINELGNAAIGVAEANVRVGVPSTDPTGVGKGVND